MTQPIQRSLKTCTAQSPGINEASGDGGKTQNHKGKCRSNIPKSLRYDLENALVGLCDVWFGEIKPYLVRNNIKVHVNKDEAGDQTFQTDCSHLDPASSASHCSLCQLLFNAANSIESAVCQATSNTTVPNVARISDCHSLTTAKEFPVTQVLRAYHAASLTWCVCWAQNCNLENQSKPRSRKKKSPAKSKLKQKHLVPRLCYTYEVPVVPEPNYKVPRNKSTKKQNFKPCIMKYISPNEKFTCDKYTQTDFVKRVIPNKMKKNTSNYNFRSISKEMAISEYNDDSPLFKEDLINIIAKSDKRLKLLYKSPTREECPSFMNLCPAISERKGPRKSRKSAPWK